MSSYLIDVTKAAILAYPNMHIIRGEDDRIIALCPLYDEKVCEGQFSFAPIVERALNSTPPVISVKVMRLSDGRADYFVSICAGDREVTPHVFREEYKAAYHVALYQWLLNDGPRPDLMAFGPDEWPAQSTVEADSENLRGIQTAAINYIAAVNGEPEKDGWDTEDGKEAPGAERFASDWSWREYDVKKQKAFDDLRAAVAGSRAGSPTETIGGDHE